METKVINIRQEEAKIQASKDMILSIIDFQIKKHRIQHLSDWERNHNISSERVNAQINALVAKKEEIKNWFKSRTSKDALVDLNISIDIAVKEETSVAV